MMNLGTYITAVFAAAAVAAGASSGDESGAAARTALVVDAAEARDGRELVDVRLRDADAEVRLPRTPAEARTDVRYLAALGYRVVVAGPDAVAAAATTGLAADRTADVGGALAALTP